METKNNDIGEGLMTIGDFADFVEMTPNVLRKYDELGIFSPMGRGSGSQSQYRFYSPLQITTVNMIRVLTGIGVTLEEIKELLDSRTDISIYKLLTQHKDRLAGELRFVKEAYSVVKTYCGLLNEAIGATETELSVTKVRKTPIILGKKAKYHDDIGFINEFLRFCREQRKPKLNQSFPIGGCFKNMDAFLKNPSQPTRFLSIDSKGCDVIPKGLYLIGYTRGYYGETNDLPQRMDDFAKKNGLIYNGHVYNIYVIDEISEINPHKYLLQASVSVTETKRVSYANPRNKDKSN